MIWTNETSVCLGVQRGKIHVWRMPAELYDPTVIHCQFAGFSKFMFWGLFSWYHKGPCHVWGPKTLKEKKKAEKDLKRLNALREPIVHKEWEMNTLMRRMGL